jgi:PAS domain S-box-containing protein
MEAYTGLLAKFTELFVAILTLGLIFYKIHRVFMKTNIVPLREDINFIKESLSPNGGSSLRDSVDRIEGQVMKADTKHKLLAEVLNMGVFEADRDGMFQSVNKEWSEMSALSPMESKGNGWIRGVSEGDREKVYAEWKACVEQERDFYMKFRLNKELVRGHAIVIKDVKGNVVNYIGSVTPIKESYIEPIRMAQ